jgi:hypothetical protein
MKRLMRLGFGIGAALTLLCTGASGRAAAVSENTSVTAANILANAAMYGGRAQTNAVCYVTDAGSSSVTLSIPAIILNRTPVTLTSNTCRRRLGARETCDVTANVSNESAYFCRVIVKPNKDETRGTFELRDSNGNVLQHAQLR